MSNIDKAKQAVEAAQKQLEDAMKAHYDYRYVKRSDYDALKAKLENLERKYDKLKRRHDKVGGKYLVVKKERNYLIDINGYEREDFTE